MEGKTLQTKDPATDNYKNLTKC